MSTPNPIDTVTQLVKAVNQGHLEAAVACYEPEATLIVQSGQVVIGTKALREVFAGFIAMKRRSRLRHIKSSKPAILCYLAPSGVQQARRLMEPP